MVIILLSNLYSRVLQDSLPWNLAAIPQDSLHSFLFNLMRLICLLFWFAGSFFRSFSLLSSPPSLPSSLFLLHFSPRHPTLTAHTDHWVLSHLHLWKLLIMLVVVQSLSYVRLFAAPEEQHDRQAQSTKLHAAPYDGPWWLAFLIIVIASTH